MILRLHTFLTGCLTLLLALLLALVLAGANPRPNTTYKLDNGDIYVTDAQGRVTTV